MWWWWWWWGRMKRTFALVNSKSIICHFVYRQLWYERKSGTQAMQENGMWGRGGKLIRFKYLFAHMFNVYLATAMWMFDEYMYDCGNGIHRKTSKSLRFVIVYLVLFSWPFYFDLRSVYFSPFIAIVSLPSPYDRSLLFP